MTEVLYRVGDRVRVRRAYPPGHVRTPWYIRGQEGVVERICGSFRNPEELAYGRLNTEVVPLYRVRFQQSAIWPDYTGGARDTVDIELYQHWLERAS